MKIQKVTPILFVERIEPALALWCDRLGFEKIAEVPHDGQLGFVLLVRDGHEVMLQSRASVAADLPAVAAGGASCAVYLDVDSLDEAIAATAGAEVIVPRRSTTYGVDEVWLRDPTGSIVGFAQLRAT